MTRLHINIKEADKAVIVFNLLKKLPFVEIEKTDEEEDIHVDLKDSLVNSSGPCGIWKDSSNADEWFEECERLMDKAQGDSKGKKWTRADLYDV
ncbi:hypothetical protein LDC_1138 [sediment metagenome]|uniref:Uncharacterized protein n=1 Tax=sediment metagenome TaxID=749907 RepID=D9PHY4_9ZZZZ